MKPAPSFMRCRIVRRLTGIGRRSCMRSGEKAAIFDAGSRRVSRQSTPMPELCPGQSGREDRNDAGRNAYLAAFHAAQAFIFERTGRVAKTHQGVRVEFNRLAKGEMRIDRERQRFLAQAYNLKSVADYEMGPEAV